MAAMKIVCLALVVLVGNAHAYFPNMQQMAQSTNLGMNSNTGVFGQQHAPGFNYNSGTNNQGVGALNPGMAGLNPGMAGLNQGMGALNPGMTGHNQGMGALNPGMNANGMQLQTNQQAGKAKQGGPISDMLSMLLLTKGQTALSDPNMKTMALVAMMNGETMPQHVMMALSGQNPMMNPLAPGGARKAPAGEAAEGGAMNQIFDMMLLQQLNSGLFR